MREIVALETFADTIDLGKTDMSEQEQQIVDHQAAKQRHVDDFIDFGSVPFSGEKNTKEGRAEIYARIVFTFFRLPATAKMDMEPFILKMKLFCIHEGEVYRVTGASRLGDVWLTKNFQQDTGYQKRVLINECAGWSNTPDINNSTAHLALEDGVIQFCMAFDAAGSK